MPKFIDLTGQKFGRLVVIKWVKKNEHGDSYWLCKCDCGKEKIILGNDLKRGKTKSCGCLRVESTIKRFTKHGHYKNGKINPIYQSWNGMIQRCTNPKHKHYKNYGGRGITVCDEWLHSFSNFERDNPGWEPGLTIERRDKNGNYCPDNCKWATRKEQARNTRNNCWIICFGRTQLLIDWAEEYNINPGTLWSRIYNLGWSAEKALMTPVKKYKRRKANG